MNQSFYFLIGVFLGLSFFGTMVYIIYSSANAENKKEDEALKKFTNRKFEKYKEIFKQHQLDFDEYSFKTSKACFSVLTFKTHDFALFSFHGYGSFENKESRLISECYSRYISWFDLKTLKNKDEYLNALFSEMEANACLNYKAPPKDWEALGEMLIWTELDAIRIVNLFKLLSEYPLSPSVLKAMSFLNLSKGFSESELKTAYRLKLIKSHPDHGGSREALEKVQESFNELNKMFI